jgi:hypothetical protein
LKKHLVLILLALSLMPAWPAHARKQPKDDGAEKVKIPFKEAESGTELRKIRRMGVGAQAAGALGMGGMILDLNMTPQWSFTSGFGGGEGFQAYMFEARYVISGDWLMPYLNFGFTHWGSLSKSGQINKTKPSILADKLLNDDEKAAGEYQKNMFLAGIGLQFMQLKGEWAGTSAFAEITVLFDIGNFVAAPTGTVGMLYYF